MDVLKRIPVREQDAKERATNFKEGCLGYIKEEAMEEALKDAKIIVADPLYRPICPKNSSFYELPHVAFSGRIYIRREINEPLDCSTVCNWNLFLPQSGSIRIEIK